MRTDRFYHLCRHQKPHQICSPPPCIQYWTGSPPNHRNTWSQGDSVWSIFLPLLQSLSSVGCSKFQLLFLQTEDILFMQGEGGGFSLSSLHCQTSPHNIQGHIWIEQGGSERDQCKLLVYNLPLPHPCTSTISIPKSSSWDPIRWISFPSKCA